MAGWTIIVYILFPVPLFSLLLLCLPFPGSVGKQLRKGILGLIDKVLFSRVLGGFSLYQLCLVLSAILFLVSCYETARAATKLEEARGIILDMKEDRLRCQKWRSERNFWLTMMSSVLWLVLYRVHNMSKEILFLRTEIADKEKAK